MNVQLQQIKSILPLLMLTVFLSSCGRKYKVEGNSSITGLDGKMLFLKALQNGEWVQIDSAEVIHGVFKMSGDLDSVRLVSLYMDEESIMPLVLEEGTVEISLHSNHVVAKGTPLNDKLYEFIGKRDDMEDEIEALERKESQLILEGSNFDDIHEKLQNEAYEKVTAMNDYAKQFIMDNYENVLGPSVFTMMCSTMPYPMMTPRVEDIMRTAPASFKQNPFVKDFLERAKENMRLIEEQKRMSH